MLRATTPTDSINFSLLARVQTGWDWARHYWPVVKDNVSRYGLLLAGEGAPTAQDSDIDGVSIDWYYAARRRQKR